MRHVVVLLWVLAAMVATFLALLLWPTRLRLSASYADGRASVSARVSLWPHLFFVPVYRRSIIPRSQRVKTPAERLASVKETIDRLQGIAPIFSSALSERHKLISVTWNSLIGIGDAALTAIACGSFWAAKSALLARAYAWWGRKSDLPEYSVTPVFDRECFLSDLDLIVDVTIASIILAPSFLGAVRAFVAASRGKGNEGAGRDQ
ncbi:MAG: DUF2953 domain-containing protein [Firmicutes bacterium]|nr:DUF2953 domain-containing protein [Bacillota bacterium]